MDLTQQQGTWLVLDLIYSMKADLKIILKASLPLLATVLVFVVILKFGLGKVTEVREKVDVAERDQAILGQKLNVLQDASGIILSSSSTSLLALPESNPSLSVISQLRRLSAERGISLSNIKTSGEITDKSGLKRVDVTFDLEGSRTLVIDFLQSIDKFAPISGVDKIKLNEAGGVIRGSIVVKSFWSELPKKLPSLTDKINDLTADEKQTLTQISGLIKPIFVEVPPSDSTARSDPFNF